MFDNPTTLLPSTGANLFDDNTKTDQNATEAKGRIHLRVQQRNGRKTLTTIQGLPKELNLKNVLKVFKKDFACNGNIVDDEELGEVIQLQGDHRQKVAEVLVAEGVCKKDDIHIHGF